MEVKKTKKRNIILAAVLLGVTATVGTIGVTTFAKYRTQLSDVKAQITVAKWSFASDNSSTNFTIDLAKTYTASTLVSNRIAPGTSGKLDFDLSNKNTEVGTTYSIKLTNTNAPTNIQFYEDVDCTTPLTNSTLTGHMDPGATTTATIYWKWAYETGTVTDGVATGDSNDTTNGEAGSQMTVTATITGVQEAPTAQ